MLNCFSRSVLLFSSVLYIPVVFAESVDAQVTLNKSNSKYENKETITVSDNYGVWVDGTEGFSGELINSGSLLVEGTGYGIYGSPYQTRPVSLTIKNTGTIQRIQLEETKGSIIANGDPTGSESSSLIQGMVLLGADSKIYNDSGTFDDFSLDTSSGMEKRNLIALGSNSQFFNGNVFMKELKFSVKTPATSSDEKDIEQEIILRRPVYTTATVKTDHIQFSSKGSLFNSSIIDNESIIFGDGGVLRNIGLAYDSASVDEFLEEASADTDNSDASDSTGTETENTSSVADATTTAETSNNPETTLKTGTLSFGKNGQILNEMGTSMTVTDLVMGSGAQIVNGADYLKSGTSETDKFYKMLAVKTIEREPEEEEGEEGDTDTASSASATASSTSSDKTNDEEEIDQAFFTPIPKQAKMNIKNAALGANSTINLTNNSVYQGETFETGFSSKLNILGSEMELYKSDGTSTLSMGANSSIMLDSSVSGSIENPMLETADKKYEIGSEQVFEGKEYSPKLTVDKLMMGPNGQINLLSGSIRSKQITMDDNGAIINDAELTATDMLVFKEKGTLLNRGNVTSHNIVFGKSGTLKNESNIVAKNITMDDEATIETSREIKAFVTVGNNSTATMISSAGGAASSDIADKEDFEADGGFTGGFTKAEGARNTTIISDIGLKVEEGKENGETGLKYRHGWLAGGVNVDNILIKQGELWAQDDIHGQISINNDSSLRVVGTNVAIYDPIMKADDAENTKLIVDLDGDDNFYKTGNTIAVDKIIMKGGGLQIQTPVEAEKIIFGSDTTVRLKGNYYVGDMVELDDDASNTTLDIDGGQGEVIDSTGTIRLDRIVVESGVFNMNHTIEAVYKADNASMPSANEEGLELGTDTAVNVNTPDVKVNRIVRNQLALRNGENVTNTTVNITGGHLQVERNTDIDKLNIEKGQFEFMNRDTNNVVNIGEGIHVGTEAQIAGDGVINLRNGSMDIDYGGRLSVSTYKPDEKAIGTMKVVQADSAYSDANNIADEGNATLNMAKGSILDLRADNGVSDKIEVSGTVNLADGTRILLRDIQANQEYELMSATQLNGNIDKLATSFLWAGKRLTNEDNKLMLQISGIQTLNEGISSTKYSKNVWNIAQTLTTINNSTASDTIDPFLDSVFYALNADEAVKVMNEYSPEGYLNTYQNVLRTNRTFRQSALSELDAMRTYRDMENEYQRGPLAVYNPDYYGRPGYEEYYAKWTNQKGGRNRRTRTDKGGLWAKPFAVDVTQDDKDNMSGYQIKNYGLTAGVDRRFGSFSIGLMGLYANGSIDQSNQVIKTNTSTYGAGVYGSVRPYRTRKFFDFYALWTETKNKSKHLVNTLVESAKADYNTTAYSVGADMGYDMPLTRNLIITPKVGIDYTQLEADEIEEKGSGHSLLKLTPEKMTSIQTPVEVRAAFNYMSGMNKFKPEVHARWTHEFGDTAVKGKSLFVNYKQPFTVSGLNVDKDVFTLGGSLLWLYNVSELELRYDYDFSTSSTAHTVNVGYKYLF